MEKSFNQLTESEIQRQYRTILTVFILAAVMTAFLTIVFVYWVRKRDSDLRIITHTQEVLISLTLIQNSFTESDIEGRDSILNSRLSGALESNRQAVRDELTTFRELTIDNQRQQGNAQRLTGNIERRFKTVDFLIELSEKKNLQTSVEYMRTNHVIDELRNVQSSIRASQDEELRLLDERRLQSASSRNIVTFTGGIGLAFLIVTLFLSFTFVKTTFFKLVRAGQKFRDAYMNARTGQDGVVELPEDVADEILELLSENKVKAENA